MFCLRCNQRIALCTCPDIEERLADLAKHPNIELPTCAVCGRVLASCICVPGPAVAKGAA